MNNMVIVIALVIGASWAWGSIGMMQRNYALQKEIDTKSRERKLAELQVQMLHYEQKYYQSNEYKELSARAHLGLADPGEKVLALPPNSKVAKKEDAKLNAPTTKLRPAPTNFQQWVNFLFGGNRQDLPK